MRLSNLLGVLGVGVTLGWGLAWLGAALFGLVILVDVFVVVPGDEINLVPLTLGLVAWMLVTALGLGHLRVALGRAQLVGPLDGEVAERVRLGASWLLVGSVMSVVVLLPWSWAERRTTELWFPSSLLSTLLGLTLPLLLIGLSGWLNEGRRLRDRAREVV